MIKNIEISLHFSDNYEGPGKFINNSGGDNMNKVLLKEIVNILIKQAKLGQTVTYGELSNKINGEISPQGFYNPLVMISECAERNNYPKLSALVVNSQTGMPGRGFFVNFAPGIPEHKWIELWNNECFDIMVYDDWDSFLRFF